jgi:predicted chitinase
MSAGPCARLCENLSFSVNRMQQVFNRPYTYVDFWRFSVTRSSSVAKDSETIFGGVYFYNQ